MAYDEGLAERVRDVIPKATEKRMFGGVGWMERGNMVAGVMKDELLVRVKPEETDRWLKQPGARRFDMGPVKAAAPKGWILVSPEAVAEEPELKEWIERSQAFVRTLPAK
jgi:TfoX/Sxy family transcriptional regulator of competence genes